MNARRRAGNQPFQVMVRAASRSVGAALVGALLTSSGCAPTVATAPVTLLESNAPKGTPEATVRVLDHVGWPLRISRVRVALDGALLADESYDRARPAPPALLISAALAPGAHTAQILAEARVSVTARGPECAVTLRAAVPFAAAESEAAEITADLYLRGAELRFEERLAARTRVRGPRLDDTHAHRLALADEQRCRAMPPPDAASCRVEAAVAEATRRRDVIEVLCLRDKLDAMKVLTRIRDEARARAEAPRKPIIVPPEDGAPEPSSMDRFADEIEQRVRIQVLDQRLVALGREAEQCLSEDLAYRPSTEVTADEACFARSAPEID